MVSISYPHAAGAGETSEVRLDVRIKRLTLLPLQSMHDLTSPTLTSDGKRQAHHDTGIYVPYSFRTMTWVLLRPLPTDIL